MPSTASFSPISNHRHSRLSQHKFAMPSGNGSGFPELTPGSTIFAPPLSSTAITTAGESLRPSFLDESALSPAEYATYVPALLSLRPSEAEIDGLYDEQSALQYLRERCKLELQDEALILSLFERTPLGIKPGHFYAWLRLVSWTQQGQSPSKRLLFTQTQPTHTFVGASSKRNSIQSLRSRPSLASLGPSSPLPSAYEESNRAREVSGSSRVPASVTAARRLHHSPLVETSGSPPDRPAGKLVKPRADRAHRSTASATPAVYAAPAGPSLPSVPSTSAVPAGLGIATTSFGQAAQASAANDSKNPFRGTLPPQNQHPLGYHAPSTEPTFVPQPAHTAHEHSHSSRPADKPSRHPHPHHHHHHRLAPFVAPAAPVTPAAPPAPVASQVQAPATTRPSPFIRAPPALSSVSSATTLDTLLGSNSGAQVPKRPKPRLVRPTPVVAGARRPTSLASNEMGIREPELVARSLSPPAWPPEDPNISMLKQVDRLGVASSRNPISPLIQAGLDAASQVQRAKDALPPKTYTTIQRSTAHPPAKPRATKPKKEKSLPPAPQSSAAGTSTSVPKLVAPRPHRAMAGTDLSQPRQKPAPRSDAPDEDDLHSIRSGMSKRRTAAVSRDPEWSIPSVPSVQGTGDLLGSHLASLGAGGRPKSRNAIAAGIAATQQPRLPPNAPPPEPLIGQAPAGSRVGNWLQDQDALAQSQQQSSPERPMQRPTAQRLTSLSSLSPVRDDSSSHKAPGPRPAEDEDGSEDGPEPGSVVGLGSGIHRPSNPFDARQGGPSTTTTASGSSVAALTPVPESGSALAPSTTATPQASHQIPELNIPSDSPSTSES